MSVSPHNNIVEARQEVQCKFGRNLLRIQQLEVMVKAMVAGSVVETQSGDPHIFLTSANRTSPQKLWVRSWAI